MALKVKKIMLGGHLLLIAFPLKVETESSSTVQGIIKRRNARASGTRKNSANKRVIS